MSPFLVAIHGKLKKAELDVPTPCYSIMWTILYRNGAASGVHLVDNKERAIEVACHMLKDGCIVLSINPPKRLASEKPVPVAEIHKICAKENE